MSEHGLEFSDLEFKLTNTIDMLVEKTSLFKRANPGPKIEKKVPELTAEENYEFLS